MSTNLILKERFAANDFSFFLDANNVQMPEESKSPEQEYKALREGIAATELSNILIFQITGADAVDFLDYTLTGDVARLREERILHTLCVNLEGEIITEIYVANDDGDRFFLFADKGHYRSFEDFLETHQKGYDVRIKKLNDDYALFSIDGPYSWVPIKRTFGPEILGLRYLSLFPFEEDHGFIYVMRAGKTGEYGYWVMAPRSEVPVWFEKIWDAANESSEYPTALYGNRISSLARLESHFLNLDIEGKFTKNPYELGLFWTIQSNKEMAAGETLARMVENKIRRSIIGFKVDNGKTIKEGDRVFYKKVEIGKIIRTDHSFADQSQIGIALVDRKYCYVGLSYVAGQEHTSLKTLSMPFLLNKSLLVKMT